MFRFKQFALSDSRCGMKIGTDGLLLGAWAGNGKDFKSICDIGAGCGIVGLMLAQRFAHARVTFVENNPSAALDLADNIAASPWSDRCATVIDDFATVSLPAVDMIVSNPPFFLTGELSPVAERAAARHGESLSPLTLINYSRDALDPSGVLAMIVPAEQYDSIVEHAAFAGLNISRLCYVVTAPGKEPKRMLIELTPAQVVCRREQLTIRDTSGRFTEQYCALTRDFHLNM
ncbi:MAG: tRNA1(Val) (adenine(37)-N6)-methyltransferase [Muribaculaceae bacterium]